MDISATVGLDLFFSVERVEFELAMLKQRKIDGERRVFPDKWTDQYFFIAQKRNSCVFLVLSHVCLVCSETTSSIRSDVDRLVKDMKCQTSH